LSELIEESSDPVHVVFAVTSANHANSRYNPVPFQYRAIGIDRLATRVCTPLHTQWSIVPVPHTLPSDSFAKNVCAYVQAELGSETLSPHTTTVICSTMPLVTQFRKLGYEVHTAEYDEKAEKYIHKAPQDLLQLIQKKPTDWVDVQAFLELASPAITSLWHDYPQIPSTIEWLYTDSILKEHGDITDTRNYATYAFSMSRTEVIDRKYADISFALQAGRIVDEGCADGALLARIATDFPDSDLFGIEITREFLAEAEERVRRGEFGKNVVRFFQRNLAEKVFDDGSVDTTICNSTTHEIWSYAGGDAALRTYLRLKKAQLKPGGALVIRDVVGPEEGDKQVLLKCATHNGSNPPEEDAATPVAELSTLGRFYRFAREFRTPFTYERIEREGQVYVRARLSDISEFMAKKEYTDNWQSELKESFTHWAFSDWVRELGDAGLHVDTQYSSAYTNPWIVENYFKDRVELFEEKEGTLVALPYPPTNLVVVARA
jgi:SAM-dependent methyltransferase